MSLMLYLLLLGVLGLLVIFVARQLRLLARADVGSYSRRVGRLAAMVLLGAALGLGLHYEHAGQRAAGSEAFLRAQASRFERLYSKPDSLVVSFIGGVLLAGIAAGAYELIAWGVYLVIRPRRKSGAV